jgi:hypothetical protein
MTVTWEGVGVRPVGTMTCDYCGATFHDGKAETETSAEEGGIWRRAAAAGWRMHRPNAYRQTDVCPDCPNSVLD